LGLIEGWLAFEQRRLSLRKLLPDTFIDNIAVPIRKLAKTRHSRSERLAAARARLARLAHLDYAAEAGAARAGYDFSFQKRHPAGIHLLLDYRVVYPEAAVDRERLPPRHAAAAEAAHRAGFVPAFRAVRPAPSIRAFTCHEQSLTL
jgi:hypothetical protein